jgi:hypothetical protein
LSSSFLQSLLNFVSAKSGAHQSVVLRVKFGINNEILKDYFML